MAEMTTHADRQTASERIAGIEISLETAMLMLKEYLESLQRSPTVENAEDVCPSTRIAWAALYTRWRDPGQVPREAAAELRRMIDAALAAIDRIPEPSTALDRERLKEWRDGIAFRSQMLSLLLKEGPDAVKRALDEHRRELRRRKEDKLPRF